MSLDFIKLSRSHTGKYLAEMVQLVAEKFGVQNKICGIISDNASNNAVMIDKWKKSKWPRFKAKPHWVWCFTHILNLIVKAILKPFGPQKKNKQNNDYTSEDKDQDDAQQIEMWEEEDLDLEEDDKGVSKVAETEELDIEDINNLSDEEEDNQYTSQPCRQSLAKFQVIARKLKKLPNSKKLFADICEEHTIQTPHRIPQDVQTRWNSTFLQLPSVSCCQSAIVEWQRDKKYALNQKYQVNTSHLELADDLVVVLQPFYKITLQILIEGLARLLHVVVFIDQITEHLSTIISGKNTLLH
ncbi:hypothetical protein PSTG_00394 [Puccinia striiformis f. sp. tritici PST-78]|uniref:DUF659 domain-containing protein n=1 Tax=Puccinia striiformis f. sp. tritici PST-78 TaxID=1165861 RepID=A0A0L0W4R5_9BASI|nr:hypothetical protein PSTG_00394 [Puccinia striiformis f. sp. tritici PST-78]